MNKQPPDVAERYDITHQHHQTLFVDAGAGTGKTTSLVARVLALVRAGIAIENLAVITFTEAAAAELRDRVRTELESSEANEHIDAALAALDAAAISTLHGFAKRILSENLLEAGLPPAIEVLSDIRDDLDFQHGWQRFLGEWLTNPDKERLVERALALGVTTTHLQAFARILRDEWDRLPEVSLAPATLLSFSLEGLISQVREFLLYQNQCLVDADTMLTKFDQYRQWLALAQAAKTESAMLSALDKLPNGRLGNSGRASNWPTGMLAEIRQQGPLISSNAAELRSTLTNNALRLVLADLSAFTLAGVAKRKAEGQLRFHDLLVIAAQELRRNPTMRQRLHQRYGYLIIDEFQDTDPIQIEIARLITTNLAEVENVPWTQLTSPPGSLFFVGDPKQAIYRFRRADIRLFMQVAQLVGTVPKTLSANFRTVPGVINWVNHTFDRLLGNGVEGIQPHYVPLDPWREDGIKPEPPVVVIGGALEERTSGARRRVAFSDLAKALIEAKVEGWPIVDRATGETRAPNWSDMAVLLPVRTGLEILRQSFDKVGIPYRVEASSMVWQTAEVHDLLSVLRAVADPTDALALTAALRSSSFACSDDELAAFVAHGGQLTLAHGVNTSIFSPVTNALLELQELAHQVAWDEPSVAIERVISQCHLRQLATQSPRPRDVWRRLKFVVDQARLFADTESVSLREFLEWAQLQAAEATRQSENVLPETDDDAVRVLTVHASKGLEFPIVALAGLDRKLYRPSNQVQLLWDEEQNLEAKITKELQTTGFSVLAELEKEHEIAEHWRLMYVATTRARDHLILALHHKAETSENSKSVAQTFLELSEEQPDLWHALDTSQTPAVANVGHQSGPKHLGPMATGETRVSLSPQPSRAQWLTTRENLVERNAKPSVMVPSAIAKLDTEGPVLPTSEVEPWRRGRAGTNIGRAVHATLQLLNFNQPQNLADIVRTQAELEGVQEITNEIEAAVRSALSAPSLVKAQSSPHWRELYLASTIDGVLCEGYIDLLVETGDGYEVIDYKTDAVDDATELIDRYQLQAATYALLVEQTLHKPVNRCVFILVKPDHVQEIEIPDLEAAKTRVRSILATNARRVGAVL